MDNGRPLDFTVSTIDEYYSSIRHHIHCFLSKIEFLIENGLMNFAIEYLKKKQSILVILATIWQILQNDHSRSNQGKKPSKLVQEVNYNLTFQERSERLIKVFLSLAHGHGSDVSYLECDTNLQLTRECLHYSDLLISAKDSSKNKDPMESPVVFDSSQLCLSKVKSASREPACVQLLRNAVTQFDECPLLLKELCRNRIRWSLGGCKFKERIRELKLPSILYDFVLLPIFHE